MARASSRNSSEEAWGAHRAPQQQSPAASSLEGAIWKRAGTQTRALDAILYHPQQSHLVGNTALGLTLSLLYPRELKTQGWKKSILGLWEADLPGFWLLWTVLILFSCCCAFRHRRAKLRLQQQQRQREINLLAYHGACHGAGPVPTGSLLDLRLLSAFKPPAYEDVVHHPGTPPPPYTLTLGHPSSASSEHICCSSASSCSAHLEGTNVEGVSSHQSALPHQEGEPRAGLSPVHTPPSCRYRRLTGDSGIELCPCPDSREGEPVKEMRASATQPDLGDHSPCVLSPDSMSQTPPLGLASSYGDIP
ncbi:WW domain binding protein 1 [Cricetulus griseus]